MIEGWVGEGTAADLTLLAAYAGCAILAYVVIRALLPIADRAAKRSKFLWDDVIIDRRLRHRLSLLGPALVFFAGVRFSRSEPSGGVEAVLRISSGVLVLVFVATLSALLRSVNTVYETKPIAKDRPIDAYVQVAQLLAYMFGLVIVGAILAKKSPWILISGLGAFTAVLLLIFKDTILAFVASVQLTQNDMVDVGDWIEMPEFGADGPVTDVALHSVTVQNFDKTITTIPPYRMITGSFRNWRGMNDSGLRRIKRTIPIDISSIRFLTDAEVDRYSKFEPLQKYMADKLREIGEANAAVSTAEGVTADRRRLTNIGTFRAYVEQYLRRMDVLETSQATMLVRQLQPGPHGLPIEIYAFATTTEWTAFEAIQSDIFDHVLAMVPEFGLRVFQDPTGFDMHDPDSGTSMVFG